jgi:hypothetical protein
MTEEKCKLQQVCDDVQEIKKLYELIFRKDCDVHITFKGNYLKGTPWHISIDNREASGLVLKSATETLLSALKEELSKKISQLESEAKSLRKALGNVAS